LIIQAISFRAIAHVATDKLTPEQIGEMRVEGGAFSTKAISPMLREKSPHELN
jgi:hypothetical protein